MTLPAGHVGALLDAMNAEIHEIEDDLLNQDLRNYAAVPLAWGEELIWAHDTTGWRFFICCGGSRAPLTSVSARQRIEAVGLLPKLVTEVLRRAEATCPVTADEIQTAIEKLRALRGGN